MTASLHPAATSLLAEFDATSVSRGQRYQRQGQVLDWRAKALPDDSIELEGRVNGSSPRPYQVSVNLVMTPVPALIMSDCSCYLGGDCKHAVALLLEWLAQGGAGPAPVPGEDERQGQAWLRLLEAQQRPRPGQAGRLRYLLTRGSDRSKAVLSVQRERLLKNGGYGKPDEFRRFAEAHAEPRPPHIADADLPILGQLDLRLYSGAGTTLICDQDGYLLSLLAATGRAHCGSLEGPLLHAGPARAGDLGWHEHDGGWRLQLGGLGPDAVAVLAAPPHYLDFASGEFGPLECPASSQLLRPLLEGPALSEETLGMILPRLEPILEPLAVVPPPIAKASVRKGCKPRPCLLLHQIELGHGRNRKDFGIAALSFDYDGVTVVAETPGEWMTLPGGSMLLRDMALENEALKELRGAMLTLNNFILRRYWYHKENTLGQFIPLEQEQWPGILGSLLGRLESAGWRITVAPEFPWQRIDVDDWYGQVAEAQGDWFGVELGVEVDGRRLNLLPLLVEAIEAMSAGQLSRLEAAPDATLDLMHGDKWLRLPVSRLLPLIAVLNSWTESRQDRGKLQLRRLDAARLLQGGAATTWKAPPALVRLGRQLDDFDGIEAVPLPEGFNASLRPYQQAGLNWLAFLRRQGLGGVLADDMGLGKTVQTLAFLAHEKAAGRLRLPALVVCPTSLLANWRAESARFAPMLRLLTWHGGDRHQQAAPEPVDVILTSYALLGRDQAHWETLSFSIVLFDEAQNLKNPRSQMFGAARQLQAECRLALTGTPMENHLGELWAIFEQVMPGYLGSADEFKRHFRNPIEKDGDDARRLELVRRIKPLLVRRSKDQVATELPPKTVIVRPVALEGPQRDLYETVRSSMDSKLQEVLERKGLARSSIEILDALLKLRQVCCDPRLLKMEAARSITASAKLDLLFTLLPELIAEGRRILLFSQFTSMLGLIEQRLATEGIHYVKLTGQTRDREAPVRSFQACEVPLFLISLKAGGVGLNLTAADTVIHYDPWWNPAVEDQATDRAYRIGQDKPVFVYKLIAEGTVEERIIALQARKAALAGGVYGETEGFSGLLGADDVQALLRPLE
jgi:superfamily II DNA or RNA helicase